MIVTRFLVGAESDSVSLRKRSPVTLNDYKDAVSNDTCHVQIFLICLSKA